VNILAIDQGTSGTKAVVVDSDDRVLAVAEVPIRPDYRAGGIVEQDPKELIDSVLEAAHRARDIAGVAIDAVSLTNQGETVLAWDPETGRALSPMIVWQDGRAQSVCARLQTHAEDIAQRTGLVLDPYFVAPKLAWIREHCTEDGVVTTSDTWILHRLTGEFVTDVSTASRSLITDLDTVAYDPSLLELFGLAGERLPRIADNDEIIGTTNEFGGSVPVGGLVVDQQAALLAERCLDAGEAKCTFGTGAFLLANLGTAPIRSTHGLTVSGAWRVGGITSYCSDGQVYTAASAVRWLQDVGLLAGPEEIDRLASDDAHGTICVPALAGLAAPWWRSDASAVLQGMTLATSRADLVTAVVQGLAAQVAELADLVSADLGTPLTRLRVDGGLTRSRVFMQAVADLMQIDIEVYPSAHATPLGAVALARRSVDPSLSLADAIVAWQPERSFTPQWSADRALTFRSTWHSAVERSIPGEGS
jgi:glycerol kinase